VGDVAGVNFCEEFEFVSRKKADAAVDEQKRRFDQLFGG
jgi:hypothetical protein